MMLLRQCIAKAPRAISKTTAAAMSSSTTPYTERQARLGRPVSPHVTIYKFPITALSSISNRVTGVGLAGGIGAASAIAAIGGDIPSIIYTCQEVIPCFAPVSKFVVAFPFTYHFLSAARHVVWDNTPSLINNEAAPQLSYALFGGATVLSLGAAAYTIKSNDEDKQHE